MSHSSVDKVGKKTYKRGNNITKVDGSLLIMTQSSFSYAACLVSDIGISDVCSFAGEEWKPGCTPPAAAAAAPAGNDAAAINTKIVAQGDKIRELKAQKAEKSVVTAEVNVLLALKGEYKKATGQEWKPGCVPPAAAAAAPSTGAGKRQSS